MEVKGEYRYYINEAACGSSIVWAEPSLEHNDRLKTLFRYFAKYPHAFIPYASYAILPQIISAAMFAHVEVAPSRSEKAAAATAWQVLPTSQ